MLYKIRDAVRVVIDGVEKRPWIPMAIYLGAFALFVLASGLMIADVVDSRWRPFSDFTKEEKAVISDVGEYIGWAVAAVAVLSAAVVPLVMLCAGRFRAAFNTLVMGIAGIGASVLFMFVTGPLWFIIGLETAKATDAFGDKGAIVEEFKDYSDVDPSDELHDFLPPGARDIIVARKLYFQGHAVDFRCRVSEEDLRKFASKRKYAFKQFDLVKDDYSQFHLHNKDHKIFSQFPRVSTGKLVGHHHADYLTCAAICGSEQSPSPTMEDLIYVYDAKCSILWGTYSK